MKDIKNIVIKETTIELEEFYIIGLETRTNDKDGSSRIDIWELVGKFALENVTQRIPNRVNDNIYCVHTEYEGHYNGKYTAVIGCPVRTLESIPEDMIGKIIPASRYKVITSLGDVKETIGKVWDEVWASDLDRTYTADFEIYGIKAVNPYNAEVDTHIAIK